MKKKVIGIKNYAKGICFSILELENEIITMTNLNSDSFMPFPRGLKAETEKLHWAFGEFGRIFSNLGPFDMVAIKENENIQSRYSKTKQNAYLDAAAIIVAGEHHTPVRTFVYQNLGLNSSSVVAKASAFVPSTGRPWSKELSDAIVVAGSSF